jgi:hypothetical protein
MSLNLIFAIFVPFCGHIKFYTHKYWILEFGFKARLSVNRQINLITNDRAKRFHKSAIPPGPLPAHRAIGHGLTGRRVGHFGPSGPEAKIQNCPKSLDSS